MKTVTAAMRQYLTLGLHKKDDPKMVHMTTCSWHRLIHKGGVEMHANRVPVQGHVPWKSFAFLIAFSAKLKVFDINQTWP